MSMMITGLSENPRWDGDVYVARQGSLNRLLALKLIKPIDGERRAQLERIGKLESVEEERRQQFI